MFEITKPPITNSLFTVTISRLLFFYAIGRLSLMSQGYQSVVVVDTFLKSRKNKPASENLIVVFVKFKNSFCVGLSMKLVFDLLVCNSSGVFLSLLTQEQTIPIMLCTRQLFCTFGYSVKVISI